jgi:hypothetical protein
LLRWAICSISALAKVVLRFLCLFFACDILLMYQNNFININCWKNSQAFLNILSHISFIFDVVLLTTHSEGVASCLESRLYIWINT